MRSQTPVAGGYAGRVPDVVIRYADSDADLAWCVTVDGHLNEAVLRRKMSNRELLVAECDGDLCGNLRVDYLWSVLPHVAQIRVIEDQRRKGIGRALVARLEAETRRRGGDKIISSTRTDKVQAQEWHRHLGFRECGRLSGFGPAGEPTVFFLKHV